MRTPAQIAASRANGARSKGPVTAQGKRNSSRNGVRYGLLAKTFVLKDEHTGRFLHLLHGLIAKHQPADYTETLLVEGLARSHLAAKPNLEHAKRKLLLRTLL